MKFYSHKIIACTALLLFVISSYAQNTYQEEYIKFYLPSDIVIKTEVDEKGYLYVVTPKGISRYDGYRFTNHTAIKHVNGFIHYKGSFYFHDAQHGLCALQDIHAEPVVISGNNFQDTNPNNDHYDNIYTDKKGRVWCTDFNAIKYFGGNKSKRFIYNPKSKSINTVYFCEPEKDKVWAFTPTGVYVWDEATNTLTRHSDKTLQNIAFQNAIKIKDEILAVSRQGELYSYSVENKILSKLQIPISNENIIGFSALHTKSREIPVLYSRQKIYTKTAGGYNLIFQLEKNQINHVSADGATGIIWVSTNKGLIKLSPIKGIKEVKLPETAIATNITRCIEQDITGAVWLLNSNNTVWKKTNTGWVKFITKDAGAQFQHLDIIDNNILVSSDKGVYILKNGFLQQLPLDDFPDDAIAKKCILTQDKQLWVLCEHHAVQCYEWPSLKKIERFSNDEAFWSGNKLNDIIEANDGTIWMAAWAPTNFGIIRYKKSEKKFVDVADLSFNKNREKFFGDYVTRISQSKAGDMLFSGYGGFVRVSPDGNVNLKVDINDYPIANGHIEGIAEDSDGNVVFATADGLHLYNFKNDEVIRISQIDGLTTDNLIYGFKKLRNGAFAVGTDGAYIEVNIKKLLTPQNLNRLELSDIMVDGVLRKPTDNIELSKDENDITLHFSNLSYTDRHKVFYRYRFSDEKHWNDLGNNPQITLNHITPGSYEMLVQAGSHLGEWQARQLKIKMVAHPPFYKSTWFFVSAFLLVVAMLFMINGYLLKRQQKEALYRQKLNEAEMQTLRLQMNPHFMFNTLNSINSFIIQNKAEPASEYLTTFSKLMRNILEYSKEEYISLNNELKALKLYLELEAVRLEHSFDYTIVKDMDVDGNEINVPPLILQPFAENAIWHGLRHKSESRNLYIFISLVNSNEIEIKIEDDGIGREAAKEIKKHQTHHKSYGIEITKRRIEMLNPKNTISIIDLKKEDGSAAGTAVIIKIIL